MTFKLEDAIKIAEYYKFLIGRPIDIEGTLQKIQEVLIAPDWGKSFSIYLPLIGC